MREFSIIDSATSVEQLRMRLQDSELEQYGDAFIPDFVYEVIRRLPRFSTMRVRFMFNPTSSHTDEFSEDTNKTQKSS